jgi:hypothetical protein
MRTQKIWIILSVMVAVSSFISVASAGDFDWTKNFNIWAEADPTGFTAGLAERFGTSNTEINAVLGAMKNPADAYMIFRLGEMSSHSPNYVMERYRSEKGKGWGALAKSLGIKPGSEEFHALKQSDDLYDAHGKIIHRDKGTEKKIKEKDKTDVKGNKAKGKDKS